MTSNTTRAALTLICFALTPALPAAASVDNTLLQSVTSYELKTRGEKFEGETMPTGLVRLAFNPQPEPPREASSHTHPGSTRGFNPQPEPPRDMQGFVAPGSKTGFNPQPEPPKDNSLQNGIGAR
ncbi:MAG: hypothetical protein K8F25_02155 [Fimbriimonadaceae bacterium]|nr:hypothetical protein [Alphaproteobacteria bacterium]